MRKKHIAKIVVHKYFFLGAFTGIIFLLLGSIAAIIILHATKTQNISIHPVLETRRTVAKALPDEFKKQLEVASASAIYRVPILMYHYVENIQNKQDKIRLELNIPPNVFEQQVRTLSDAGYTFMTAKELGQVIEGKEQLPKKPVLLSFDDGHWDFATVVLPILEKYHAKATVYVISGFIGGSDFMTSQELQEVIKSGIVDVGAHTVHHISLRGRPQSEVQYEIDQSKAMLEQDYHIQVVSFAYPDGRFDQQAIQIVQNDGFTTAVSTAPGIEQSRVNKYFLYRLRPSYRTGQSLLTWLSQDQFSAY